MYVRSLDVSRLKKSEIAWDILHTSGVLLAVPRLDGDGRYARWSVGQTLCAISLKTVSNVQDSLERECNDETRVSLSRNRRLPFASVSGRSVGRRSTRQTCPKSHNRTARHLQRGKLRWGRERWPPDARPLRLVARSSIQRTGPCWYRVRRRSGRGLCRKRGIIRGSELDGRRFPV